MKPLASVFLKGVSLYCQEWRVTRDESWGQSTLMFTCCCLCCLFVLFVYLCVHLDGYACFPAHVPEPVFVACIGEAAAILARALARAQSLRVLGQSLGERVRICLPLVTGREWYRNCFFFSTGPKQRHFRWRSSMFRRSPSWPRPIILSFFLRRQGMLAPWLHRWVTLALYLHRWRINPLPTQVTH